MLIQENVPLAPLTTLKVGGPARYFVQAHTIAEVGEAVSLARSRNLAFFVLGGGSNLVISDAGWPGLVLKVSIPGVEERSRLAAGAVLRPDRGRPEPPGPAVGTERLVSGGGVRLEPVRPLPARLLAEHGAELAEPNTIESVLALDLKDGQVRELCNEACSFQYRTSIFNTSERGRYVILRVTYALTPDGEPAILYADLKKYFAGWSTKPSLADTREAVRQIRASKAMLITPGDEDCRSAGSFFKNPVLSDEQYKELSQRATAKGLQIPSYPALQAQRKISAAWLVEHSGFSKGYVNGRVGISRKHALAIVNRGDATAAEFVALKEQIQRRVEDTWGLRLETEPVFVGF